VAPLIHILGYDGLATAILDAIAIVFCIHARITQDATLSIQSVDASHSHIGPADAQVAASHSAVTSSSSPASGNNAKLLRLVPSGEKEAGPGQSAYVRYGSIPLIKWIEAAART
jgi:hypothetical protein